MLMNPFLSSKQVREVVEEFDSPLYVFYEKDFRRNFEHLNKSFRRIYENYIPAYSYKTNYTPYICKTVKDLGGYAEVVSDMEYLVAKKIGYENKNIIYNGPLKGPLMAEHILKGGISNIDNEEEALKVVELAKNNPNIKLKIGIRINTDIGAGFVSRFGMVVGSPEMDRVVLLLKSQPNLHLVGLHIHVSRARYISAWQRRIDNILEAADKYIDGNPEYIDVGSGMFADMDDYLKRQFTVDVATYEEYAVVVAGTMAKHYVNFEKKPMLISEPGTTVVSRYLSLVTTVRATKTILGKNIAILDCDIHNAGETCQMMRLPYTLISCGDGKELQSPVDLTGFTCLEQDCLFEGFPEAIKTGDIIEFGNVGGYSVVYKPPFIQPNCAMITVKEDKSFELIKRKETFEDIFKTFKF